MATIDDDTLERATAVARRGRPPADLPLIDLTCKVCGAAATRTTGLCAAHAHVALAVDEEKTLVKRYLEKHAYRAAELQVAGAEIAARKGDTRPAEWLLLHTRVVEPVRTQHEGGGGVVVNIGMVLPGCGQ